MRVAVASLVVAAGCGFHPGMLAGTGDGAPDDAAVFRDAAPDTPTGDICFGTSTSSLFTVCYPPGSLPTTSYTVGAAGKDFDTGDSGGACPSAPTSHGVKACVIAGNDITINGYLTVTGKLPLVLLATGTITITGGGTIDVSSNVAGEGTDDDASSCNPAGAGASASSGGGGGAGGSFGTVGGNGGGGNNQASSMTGIAVASTAALTLRGGCAGSPGGDGAFTGGDGGHAGGAVYLLAGGSINIAGSIYASGQGGGGGASTAGGGGGGTGGLIGLDAPAVTVHSGTSTQPEVVTNGGAGGGGGGKGMLDFGGDGGDGTLVSTPGAYGGSPAGTPASGGGGVGTNWSNTTGGAGGLGAAGTGGGGGGGGYGIIWVVGTYTNVDGDVSPESPTVNPQ